MKRKGVRVMFSRDQDWRSFWRYHDYLLKAVLVGGASLMLGLIGVVPVMSKVDETRGRLEKERKELNKLSQQVLVLDNLDENILKERLRVVDGVLPPNKNVVAYLNTLDGLSRELGLSMGEVSLSPGEVYRQETKDKGEERGRASDKDLEFLETEIRVTGELSRIYHFLRQVEKIAPLMVIRDVQMTRVNEGVVVLSLKLGMAYAEPKASGSLRGEVRMFDSGDERVYKLVSGFKNYNDVDLTVEGKSEEEQGSGERDLFRPLDQLNLSLQTQVEGSSPSSQSSQSVQR